ncbi:MAG: TetR-like C-terminal domain-containing protein [Eubacteriales bacterium]|nr:TetR-like C-terminal domain-containing protein [Eubacteriales bacterium]
METGTRKKDDRRVRRTKKLLKDALAELLLQKNLNEITIKEIVELADINRGTFYLHYRDIYDMMTQIEAEMLRELEEIADRFPYPKLIDSPKPYICEVFQYVSENQQFCRMLLGPYGDMAFVEKLKKLVEKRCFSSLMEAFPKNAQINYQYFATYAVSGCLGLIQVWLENGMEISAQEISDVAERLIQNGMDFLAHSV